ncbi:MAG TPA: ribonuclease E/G, partial [Alphaproteobacteria bacterium]|nr:ribonuclease E/G [Alphaproteobacteria bacterium]
MRNVESFNTEWSNIKFCTIVIKDNNIFDEYGITPEIDKLLQPKIWLKSGGYIVINQTEALV